MQRILASLILVAAIALTGCQSVTEHIVEIAQPDPAPHLHANACKANLARINDGQSAGFLTVRPGNLCVNVEGQLVGLPPKADLTLAVRRNHAATVDQAGSLVNVTGTNFTGVVGTIRTSISGSASVKLSSNNITFTEDTLVGRGLCITNADGELVASGVLGISEEH
jgi:hypothetical protein